MGYLARSPSIDSISSCSSAESSSDSEECDRIPHVQVRDLGRQRRRQQVAQPKLDLYRPSPASSQPPSIPSYAIRAPPAQARPDSIAPPSPTFNIPSETTVRRAKMDRVRRKLGDGVPADMVFHPEAAVHPQKPSTHNHPATIGKTPGHYAPAIVRSPSPSSSASSLRSQSPTHDHLQAISENDTLSADRSGRSRSRRWGIRVGNA